MRISDWSSDVCSSDLPGQEGVIVDPERFVVELFFNAEDVIIPPTDEIILGPASTGPSLIQTINFSAATAGGNSSRVRFGATLDRSEEHTSELQSLMRISYAVFCLKKKKQIVPKAITRITHLVAITRQARIQGL